MAQKINVLLVEHDSKDLGNIMTMLQYCSCEVTTAKLASTALSILSKGKTRFDVVMANMNSPDSCGFQLLQDAVKMNLFVIMVSDDDDAITTTRVLEQGAFLCIKKPIAMQILRYLWQFVFWGKKFGLKEQERRIRDVVELQEESGEEDIMIMEGNQIDGNNYIAKKQKTKEKANSGYRKKVLIEWTDELHENFMHAVRELGEGRCYPNEILELMNVPGLTRMQVASHLQKCRDKKWIPPSVRSKYRVADLQKKASPPRDKPAHRVKTFRFGSMPPLDLTYYNIHIARDYNSGSRLVLGNGDRDDSFAREKERLMNMGQHGRIVSGMDGGPNIDPMVINFLPLQQDQPDTIEADAHPRE